MSYTKKEIEDYQKELENTNIHLLKLHQLLFSFEDKIQIEKCNLDNGDKQIAEVKSELKIAKIKRFKENQTKEFQKNLEKISVLENKLQELESKRELCLLEYSNKNIQIQNHRNAIKDRENNNIILEHKIKYKGTKPPPPFKCMYCTKNDFMSIGKVVEHQDSDHPDKGFECGECGDFFNRKYLLNSHKKEFHPNNSDPFKWVNFHKKKRARDNRLINL